VRLSARSIFSSCHRNKFSERIKAASRMKALRDCKATERREERSLHAIPTQEGVSTLHTDTGAQTQDPEGDVLEGIATTWMELHSHLEGNSESNWLNSWGRNLVLVLEYQGLKRAQQIIMQRERELKHARACLTNLRDQLGSVDPNHISSTWNHLGKLDTAIFRAKTMYERHLSLLNEGGHEVLQESVWGDGYGASDVSDREE
jgi:hypothetical protein